MGIVCQRCQSIRASWKGLEVVLPLMVGLSEPLLASKTFGVQNSKLGWQSRMCCQNGPPLTL
jgi:hypothetical protein